MLHVSPGACSKADWLGHAGKTRRRHPFAYALSADFTVHPCALQLFACAWRTLARINHADSMSRCFTFYSWTGFALVFDILCSASQNLTQRESPLEGLVLPHAAPTRGHCVRMLLPMTTYSACSLMSNLQSPSPRRMSFSNFTTATVPQNFRPPYPGGKEDASDVETKRRAASKSNTGRNGERSSRRQSFPSPR